MESAVHASYIVTDLGYGDAGKGATVDCLARQEDSVVVVRHCGGAQAAHNVVTTDGRHHTFSQFGSGSFVPGARTHQSRFMMISPPRMISEAAKLIRLGETDIWQRLTVDEGAPVIMPWHQAANQLRELARGPARHGSVGLGISEVQRDLLVDDSLVVRAGELRNPEALIKRLKELQRAKFYQMMKELKVPDSPQARDAWGVLNRPDLVEELVEVYVRWVNMGQQIVPGSYLQTLADQHDAVIFEGSQGVLLDQWFGFHPYTTWTKTTSENAETLLREIDHSAKVTRLGILRAYTTRHGPGPFVTEDPTLAEALPELHNGTGMWMGEFRYGHLDLVAHRYAIDATRGVDQLVVTGLDRSDTWRYCDEYVPPAATDLDAFFSLSKEGMVTGIKCPPDDVSRLDHLESQGRLTELLQSCSPQYRTPSTVDGNELLRAIEDTLGVPVGIASYGPTAADKRVLVA